MIAAFTIALCVSLNPQADRPFDKVPPAVDAVLTRLEKKGDEIKDLRCKLEYRIDDKINLDQMTKYGAIWFKRAQPHDMFLIHFHKLVQDDIPSRMKEWYLFNNRWLWEVKQRTTTIIMREIVAPGKTVDLFDVETAPFPVPFGQKKDKILKSFSVSLSAPTRNDPKNTDHLVCVPKPGTSLAKDFERLEFFVSRETNLPIRIVVTELGGNKVTTATFENVATDSGLTDKDFAPRPEWKKYSIVKEYLAKPKPALK